MKSNMFSISIGEESSRVQLFGIKAVMEIESEVERIRGQSQDGQRVKQYMDRIDSMDQIFGLSRAFYIAVKMISEKLSNEEGFTQKDRIDHYLTLVNFTEFSQLRLIMICIQFMDYESCKYLSNNIEFKMVIEDVGLSYELY